MGNKTEEKGHSYSVIEKQNRIVGNTDADARMIAMVLKRERKELDYGNVKRVIRTYFNNKRVYNSRIEQLIKRINTNGYMN